MVVTRPSRHRYRAFSLLELVIVLVIIGVLAAVAMRRVPAPIDAARFAATMENLRLIEQAAMLYHVEHDAWPADQNPGVFPPELTPYLGAQLFQTMPALGRLYDWNLGWGPFPVNVSVWANPVPADDWRAFDELYDDGDLTTGYIRRQGKSLCMEIR